MLSPFTDVVVTTGTTAVTLVTGPSAGEKKVVSIARINNRDTVAINARIEVLRSSVAYVVASDPALAVGATLVAVNITLETGDLLQVDLGAAVTTTEADATASGVIISA